MFTGQTRKLRPREGWGLPQVTEGASSGAGTKTKFPVFCPRLHSEVTYTVLL